jgi:hypothetical protein
MIESLMLCGVGLLAGCLLMLMFVPLIHRRAVRLTTRDVVEAMPLAASEIQGDKDLLRAEFAMAVRRLEVGTEGLRLKLARQQGELGRAAIEISRMRVELDRKTAHIFALQARDEVRRSFARRIAKLVLYLFVRANREPRIKFATERHAQAPVSFARAA